MADVRTGIIRERSPPFLSPLLKCKEGDGDVCEEGLEESFPPSVPPSAIGEDFYFFTGIYSKSVSPKAIITALTARLYIHISVCSGGVL